MDLEDFTEINAARHILRNQIWKFWERLTPEKSRNAVMNP